MSQNSWEQKKYAILISLDDLLEIIESMPDKVVRELLTEYFDRNYKDSRGVIEAIEKLNK